MTTTPSQKHLDQILSDSEKLLPESHVAILAREVISLRQRIVQLEAPHSAAHPVCRICGQAAYELPSGAYLNRVNEFGVPGVWQCSVTCEKIQPSAAVVVPEAYPGQREHVAFLGALKYELQNSTPDQTPTSFDINRDYFEHYANVFTKDNERMAHGVGFLNGAAWHRKHWHTTAPLDAAKTKGDA